METWSWLERAVWGCSRGEISLCFCERTTRSLSEVNEALIRDKEAMDAEIHRLKSEIEGMKAQHMLELEDLRAQLKMVPPSACI